MLFVPWPKAAPRWVSKSLLCMRFSVENWKRPRHEVEALWVLLRHYLKRELPTLMKNDIQLSAIGRIDSLPEPFRRIYAAPMGSDRAQLWDAFESGHQLWRTY